MRYALFSFADLAMSEGDYRFMSRQKLKQYARRLILTPRQPHLLFVSLIYILVGLMLMLITQNLSDLGQFQLAVLQQSMETMERVARTGVPEAIILPAFRITVLGTIFFIAPGVMGWMMDLGYLFYARGIAREEAAGYQCLLEGFNYFVKGILVRLIRTVLMGTGLFLLIFPGVFLRIAFSQVEFLLLDHPEKGVFWFFRESWRLMRGRIFEYFMLRLSFIGWIFLETMISWIIPIFSNAVRLWTIPYVTLTRVNYYHAIIGQAPSAPEAGWQRPGL